MRKISVLLTLILSLSIISSSKANAVIVNFSVMLGGEEPAYWSQLVKRAMEGGSHTMNGIPDFTNQLKATTEYPKSFLTKFPNWPTREASAILTLNGESVQSSQEAPPKLLGINLRWQEKPISKSRSAKYYSFDLAPEGNLLKGELRDPSVIESLRKFQNMPKGRKIFKFGPAEVAKDIYLNGITLKAYMSAADVLYKVYLGISRNAKKVGRI